MNPSENHMLFTIALALVGVFFGLLMAVIGWIGNKLYNKVDEVSRNLVTMASELHQRVNSLDRRLIRVELEHKVCDTDQPN